MSCKCAGRGVALSALLNKRNDGYNNEQNPLQSVVAADKTLEFAINFSL